MSTPSPLQPQSQGALAEASSPKSRVRITVLTILALHVVVIGGLLLQGCDKRPTRTAAATNTVGSLPPLTDAAGLGGFPGDATATPGGGTLAGGGTGLGTGAGGGVGAGPGTGAGLATPGAGASTDLGGGGRALGGGTLGGGSLGGGAGTAPGLGVPPVVGGGLGSTSPGLGGGGVGGLPPVTTLPPVGATPAQGTEHTIRPNDRIADLAKKYNVSESAILEANPTAKPRSLRVGDKLMIPPPTPATAAAPGGAGAEAAPSVGSAAPASGEVYVVKQGDTLARIARKYGISVKQLKSANKLKSDRIVPKQKLSIPPKAAASGTPTTTASARAAGGAI